MPSQQDLFITQLQASLHQLDTSSGSFTNPTLNPQSVYPVQSLSSGDSSITVGGSTSSPTISVNTGALDQRYSPLTSGTVILSQYGTTSKGGTALNAAIAALPANGGTVFVPSGDWTLDVPVTWNKDQVTIQGCGITSRFLFDASLVSTAFSMSDTTGRTIHMRDLRITKTNPGNSGTAINASYVTRGQFINLYIDGNSNPANSPLNGIVFTTAGTYYNLVQHCRVMVGGSGSSGVSFSNVANSNEVNDLLVFGTSGTSGVVVDAHNILLVHPDVESGSGVGVDIRANGHDCTVVQPYLELNVINIKLAAGVQSPTIVGGFVADGTTTNVNDLGSQGLSYLGVRHQYKTLTYRTNGSSLPTKRWAEPYLKDMATTSQAFVAAGTWYASEFELQDAIYTDGLEYIVGATSSGNVIGAIYGPIVTEEVGTSAPLACSSASVAQGTASTPQFLSWSTPTLLRAGRYYAAILGSLTTGTYMRLSNQNIVPGWGGSVTNAAGSASADNTWGTFSPAGSGIPGLKIRATTATSW